LPSCTYIQSDIKAVIRDGESDDITKSNIKELVLDDGSRITGDLFVDCTGWKQLLIGQDNIDLSDRLFIDSALAGRVKYKDPDKEMHPYTDCKAMEHGWRWRIPTRSRMGTGYCFNRSISDPDVVADDFIKHWDNRITKDELKLLDWKPQRCKDFWRGNVVTIGLSAGFIEPLESTGLALMIRGCENLEESMYNCVYNPQTDVDIYNVRMASTFENAVDYVNMHYDYCEREGKFWDYVRLSHEKSGMQKYMEDQINDPTIATDQSGRSGCFFGGTNWHVWLAQLMPSVPKKTYWYPDTVQIVDRWHNYLKKLDSNISTSVPQKIILKEWYG
jgi:tryptophan halogenase